MKSFIIMTLIIILGNVIFTPDIVFYMIIAYIVIGSFIYAKKTNSKIKISENTPTTNVNLQSQKTPITNVNLQTQPKKNILPTGIVVKCNDCGTIVSIEDKYCLNCGLEMIDNNIRVEPAKATNDDTNTNVYLATKDNNYVTYSKYDPMYQLDEKKLLIEFLNREIKKASIDISSKMIPERVLKRKKILNIIFSVLIFVFLTMIFFHFPLITYIIGAIILIIIFRITRKYNLLKFLIKEVKARPSEKISNIVMITKNSLVRDTSIKSLLIGLFIATILPIIIFWNPKILYEKADGGYAVRYYAFGISNFTSVTIPKEHNGEPVVSLRGNTFSNMFFLEEVNLPDTIKEIRGQAFKNDKKLTYVKLPKSLEYLGGGAFYGCTSLTSANLPENLNYLGGETFYGASSLKTITLSEKLTEIRGSTFEGCISLEMIKIPDSVTRIGGHAFYGNTSLRNVEFTENSKLTEIGSSAFRRCDSLNSITLPRGVSINERAFKESPTRINYFSNNEYHQGEYYGY